MGNNNECGEGGRGTRELARRTEASVGLVVFLNMVVQLQ